MKRGGAIRVTTWIHGSEGVRWRGGRRVAVRRQDDAQVDRDWPEEGISAVSSVSSVRRTNASRRQEQLGASSSEEHKTFFKKLHSNRLHQTCGPVNQQRHVCVEKCQAQRRQLRRVATELRRDRDPEAEAKHAKHGRIRTQISYLSRMTSDRGGEETVTSTHSGWRGRRCCWSVQQTTQHNDVPEQPSAGEACGREHVGQHVDRQTACRKKKGSREATPESHGVPWGGRLMECHDCRKRRTRDSNVALQDHEKTTFSTRSARGRVRRWCWETTRLRASEHDWMMLETRSQKLGRGQRTVYEQAKTLEVQNTVMDDRRADPQRVRRADPQRVRRADRSG